MMREIRTLLKLIKVGVEGIEGAEDVSPFIRTVNLPEEGFIAVGVSFQSRRRPAAGMLRVWHTVTDEDIECTPADQLIRALVERIVNKADEVSARLSPEHGRG